MHLHSGAASGLRPRSLRDQRDSRRLRAAGVVAVAAPVASPLQGAVPAIRGGRSWCVTSRNEASSSDTLHALIAHMFPQKPSPWAC